VSEIGGFVRKLKDNMQGVGRASQLSRVPHMAVADS